MNNDDIFELFKIIVIGVLGYFIIKTLLMALGTDTDIPSKCFCDYTDGVIRLGK